MAIRTIEQTITKQVLFCDTCNKQIIGYTAYTCFVCKEHQCPDCAHQEGNTYSNLQYEWAHKKCLNLHEVKVNKISELDKKVKRLEKERCDLLKDIDKIMKSMKAKKRKKKKILKEEVNPLLIPYEKE